MAATRKREKRVKKELRRLDKPKKGGSWARKQAARRSGNR